MSAFFLLLRTFCVETRLKTTLNWRKLFIWSNWTDTVSFCQIFNWLANSLMNFFRREIIFLFILAARKTDFWVGLSGAGWGGGRVSRILTSFSRTNREECPSFRLNFKLLTFRAVRKSSIMRCDWLKWYTFTWILPQKGHLETGKNIASQPEMQTKRYPVLEPWETALHNPVSWRHYRPVLVIFWKQRRQQQQISASETPKNTVMVQGC